MSLQETLSALTATLPEGPTQVAALLDAAAEVEQAAEALLADAEAKRSAATSSFEEARRALAQLADVADQQETRVEEAVAALEGGAAERLGELSDAADALGDVGDDASAALDALQGELVSAGSEARAESDQALAQAAAVVTRIEAGREVLATAAEEMVSEARELAAAVESARTGIAQSVDALRQRLAELTGRAVDRLGETREVLRQFQSVDRASLDAHGGAWADAVQALSSETEDRLRDDVRMPVAGAVEAVGEALAALASDLETARDASSELREQVGTLLDGLGRAMEPLPAAIDAVKAAAEIVGLSWS